MEETKKKLVLSPNEAKIEDGKLVITNAEAVSAFENQEFSIDSEEGNDGISFSVSISKT